MEGSVTDLCRYRLERAKEDLETAGISPEGKTGLLSIALTMLYSTPCGRLPRWITLIQASTVGLLLFSISIMSRRVFSIRKYPK